jgi:hypothetical protein
VDWRDPGWFNPASGGIEPTWITTKYGNFAPGLMHMGLNPARTFGHVDWSVEAGSFILGNYIT